MEPRLSTSRKWNPLPEELIHQIRSVFNQSFKQQIGTGVVEADGKIFPGEILVSVGYRETKSIRQSNFIVSIAYSRNKDNVLKLLHLAVDAAASLFEQFFAAESDAEFPRIWEEVQFEGRSIFVQYNTVNSELEAEADRLLGAADKKHLAQGEWTDEDEIGPEHIKAQLGLDPDDEGGDDDDEGETH